MSAPLPKAFWPLVITAGVNDKIPVTATGSIQFGVGNGVQTAFPLPAGVVSLGAVYQSGDWQGLRQLYPTPRTNLVLNSQKVGLWNAYNGGSVTSDVATAPDGTFTAGRIVYDGSGAAGTYRAVAQTSYVSKTGFYYGGYVWLRADAPVTIDLSMNTGGRTSVAITALWTKFILPTVAGNGASNVYPPFHSPAGSVVPFTIYATVAHLEEFTASTGVPGSRITTTGAAATVTDYTLGAGGLVTLAVPPPVGAVLSSPDAIFSVSIAPGAYLSVDALRAAVQTALNSLGHAFAVVVTARGRFRLTLPAPFSLQWSAGPNARDVLDTASATVAEAPSQHANGWYGEDPVADDSFDRPRYTRAQGIALSGRTKTPTFGARYLRRVKLAYLPGHKFLAGLESAAHANEALEHLFDSGAGRFRWWADASDEATAADYALDTSAHEELEDKRLGPALPYYEQTLKLLRLGAAGAMPTNMQVAPRAPVIFAIASPTSAAPVPVSGTCDLSATQMQAYVDGVQVGTAVPFSGAWTAYIPFAVSGIGQTVTATASNAAGTSPLSGAVVVYVNTFSGTLDGDNVLYDPDT
jgi:hypothetical protein